MAHCWHWRYWIRQASICLVAAGVCAGVFAETLRLSTGELPPYATEQRPDQGIALDIVRRAFANADIDVQYFFKPWTRSLEEARDGKWDGTAYWGRNPTRDTGFLISDNVLTEQWVFVYRNDVLATRQFDWKQFTDLAGLRIGASKFNTYTPEFWELQKSGALKVEFAADDLSNLRLLVAGRLDLVPLERNVACYLMGAHFQPAEVAMLRAHPRLLTNNFTTHLMLSKKLPQSAARMAAFNRGLKVLQKSPHYGEV
ncbi:MAG: transporter substrate-binding domain-containing protein, partial [Rhodoferax sp.]|nr:transporter substrate-binding domain-containing protein [Rhodoferax sp.]